MLELWSLRYLALWVQKTVSILCLLFSWCAFAQIEELENPGMVKAVQTRPYRLKHELNLTVGALPLDAFYQGLQLQAGYTFHFSDYFAWEVGRGAFVYRAQTGFRDELERKFGVLPTATEQVEYFVGSDVLFSPLNGKLALENRAILFAQLFFVGGLTVMKFTNAFRPALIVGGGLRVFASQLVSFRLQVDNHLIIPTGGVTSSLLHIMSVNLSLAINFGGT